MEGQDYSPFFDGEVWPSLTRRDDDIIIATYAKFGHLRMQHIVANIIAKSKGLDVEAIDLPWVELRHPNPGEKVLAIDGQKKPRVLRTHLGAPEVYGKTGKYIYVGRDPRDLVWNLFLFDLSASDAWRSQFAKHGFPQETKLLAFDQYWDRWFDQDGFPFWSYFDRLKSWWRVRDEENTLFLHYLDFKTDMEKVIRKICDFLNISISQNGWPELINSCGFQRISNASAKTREIENLFWNGGGQEPSEFSSNMSEFGWRKYLTQKHEIDLGRRLQTQLGETGKHWILSGDSSP